MLAKDASISQHFISAHKLSKFRTFQYTMNWRVSDVLLYFYSIFFILENG